MFAFMLLSATGNGKGPASPQHNVQLHALHFVICITWQGVEGSPSHLQILGQVTDLLGQVNEILGQ